MAMTINVPLVLTVANYIATTGVAIWAIRHPDTKAVDEAIQKMRESRR